MTLRDSFFWRSETAWWQAISLIFCRFSICPLNVAFIGTWRWLFPGWLGSLLLLLVSGILFEFSVCWMTRGDPIWENDLHSSHVVCLFWVALSLLWSTSSYQSLLNQIRIALFIPFPLEVFVRKLESHCICRLHSMKNSILPFQLWIPTKKQWNNKNQYTDGLNKRQYQWNGNDNHDETKLPETIYPVNWSRIFRRKNDITALTSFAPSRCHICVAIS